MDENNTKLKPIRKKDEICIYSNSLTLLYEQCILFIYFALVNVLSKKYLANYC